MILAAVVAACSGVVAEKVIDPCGARIELSTAPKEGVAPGNEACLAAVAGGRGCKTA